MEFYLVIVIILFVLAISDLMVGVSNDAVNFLNSAIGSKVAPRYIIMIVASLGILIGTTFSSGLMEVARKGIFNPEMFYLQEIMIVFVAVMITDVLLLDLYNTFALPTSTTVSIVFELLGASVAVAAIKVSNLGADIGNIIDYINTSKALAIILGILLSVIVAFSAGALVQFLTRLVFTFDFSKRIKRYGGLWSAITLTAITFFILLKGSKGASFITEETSDWIAANTTTILFGSMLIWFVIFQLMVSFTKINIFKPIVLVGTFALAMAFAANDLVNFIGVPLAGLHSYQISLSSINPSELLMEALLDPVRSSTLILLGAGIVMVVTLWINKKARSVTKTEVNLGRQWEGFERFESSAVSRSVVRMNLTLADGLKKIIPLSVQNFINKRFKEADGSKLNNKNKDAPAFDLLRASVNLMVASILISIATNMKLPLSTTYVTFMVAMGTSLSDRAWGRESAVYRVNGVLTVIGGWFVTAFLAFTSAAILATVIYFGDIYAIAGLVLIAGFILIRTHVLHKNREVEEDEAEKKYYQVSPDGFKRMETSLEYIEHFLTSVVNNVKQVFKSLYEADRTLLKEHRKEAKTVAKESRVLVSNIFKTVQESPDLKVKKENRYGKIISSIQEISANHRSLADRAYEHIDNNHKKPQEKEFTEMMNLTEALDNQVKEVINLLQKQDFSNLDELDKKVEEFKSASVNFDIELIQKIKDDAVGTRNSLLYLGISAEMDNISNHIVSLVNAIKRTYKK